MSNFKVAMAKRGRDREKDDEGREEDEEVAPYDALLRSMGVESSSQESESHESEEESQSDEEEGEEEEGEEEGDEEEREEKVEEEEKGQENPPGEESESGDEPLDEEREKKAVAAHDRDPFARLYSREVDLTQFEKGEGKKHVTIGAVGNARLVANGSVNLKSADEFNSPNLHDWMRGEKKRSELQELIGKCLGSYLSATIPGIVGIEFRSQIRDTFAIHAVNHILKTRNSIWKNNCELRLEGEKKEIRDQGFARCRVLIIAPMRGDAYDIVRRILSFFPPKITVQNLAKFEGYIYSIFLFFLFFFLFYFFFFFKRGVCE